MPANTNVTRIMVPITPFLDIEQKRQTSKLPPDVHPQRHAYAFLFQVPMTLYTCFPAMK
jgi:ABC-type lipoprotein release transport system permease subunit